MRLCAPLAHTTHVTPTSVPLPPAEPVSAASESAEGSEFEVVQALFPDATIAHDAAPEELSAGRCSWSNVSPAAADVVDYTVGFYNPTRRHRTLGQMSPVMFEKHWTQAQAQMKAVA